MSNSDIVRASQAAWSRADWDTYGSLLTDDFVYADPSQPLDKATFMNLGRALLTAISDWTFHTSGTREEGDKVYNTSRITGTHTGTLAVAPDMPPVPPTGRHIDLPPEEEEFTLRGGQISRLKITFAPGGGIAGLYAQVGAA